jgi:PAS domain S-box-containing protein
VADNTCDWEFWVGPDGRFIYVSPSCERIAGCRAAEFEADPELLPRLIHPEDRPHFERHRREAHAQRRMADEEFRIVRPDGEVRWIGHLCGPVFDEAGKFQGIRGSNRDMTERKEWEARLIEYQGQLRSLSSEVSRAEQRERRRIASVLHDDVIQSLALSRIKLGALRDSLSSPEQQAWLDGARALLEQAIQSTRSLTLQLSPPILHELGLEPALDWLTEQMAQQQGISAQFASDGHPKPLDEDLKVVLFTATRELLLNVAKHSRAANVKVSSRLGDGKIEISVEDDGVGFDLRQTETSRREHGGVGLFNVRERLEYLGGRCEIQSEPGRGTRVVLAAPLKPAGE